MAAATAPLDEGRARAVLEGSLPHAGPLFSRLHLVDEGRVVRVSAPAGQPLPLVGETGRAVDEALREQRVLVSDLVPLSTDGAQGVLFVAPVTRNGTVSPLEGPLGTPITVKVTGLGSGAFTNTVAVMWDAAYTGFISAVTTRGTAEGRIRAAGPVGTHVLRVTDASGAVPYLNTEQSPRKLPQFRFDFKVTSDPGPAAATLEWPDPAKVAAKPIGPITTASAEGAALPGVTAKLSPSTGPILTKTTLSASGLGAGTSVDLIWMTVKGNRASGSGWNLVEAPLAKVSAAGDGTLTTPLQIPDDLGGWHVVKLASGGKLLGEATFFIERSFIDIAPVKVKAGQTFTVRTKGIGWTELDNGYAIVYDNQYLGYGCGFNSQGDLTLNLVATGQKGTHLLDLYPMVFNAHGKPPWSYYVPWLAFAQDHPSLLMGYRLPAYRIAFEIVD